MSLPRVNPALLRVQQAVGNHRYAHRVSTLAVATLADARTLPVSSGIDRVLRAGLVPGSAHGLVRGRTYGCSGVGAVSCAITLLSEATATGSWAAWCATVSPNWRAVADTGWALDRVVQVDCGQSRDSWIACLDALAGEIDIVVVDLPAGVSVRDAQHVIDRAVRRGGVVVVLASSAEVHARLGVDVVFDVVRAHYVTHHAHLTGQVMDIRLQGRRVPVATDVHLEIPGVADA